MRSPAIEAREPETGGAVAGGGGTDKVGSRGRVAEAVDTTNPTMATIGVNGGSVSLTFAGGAGGATISGALPGELGHTSFTYPSVSRGW